jgi:hypothetical protein
MTRRNTATKERVFVEDKNENINVSSNCLLRSPKIFKKLYQVDKSPTVIQPPRPPNKSIVSAATLLLPGDDRNREAVHSSTLSSTQVPATNTKPAAKFTSADAPRTAQVSAPASKPPLTSKLAIVSKSTAKVSAANATVRKATVTSNVATEKGQVVIKPAIAAGIPNASASAD